MEKLLNKTELLDLCREYVDEIQDSPNIHSITNQYTYVDFIDWLKAKNITFIKSEEVTISDPKGLLEKGSMKLYAEKGHRVTVTEDTINNGYTFDKEQAKKFLEISKEYTIESMDVGDWSSTVVLQEIPNQHFNSVHFIDVD